LQLESAQAQTLRPRETIQIRGSTSGSFINPIPEPYISLMYPPTPSFTGVGTSNFTWGRGLQVLENIVINGPTDDGDRNVNHVTRVVSQQDPNFLRFAGTPFNVSVPKGFRLGSEAQTQGEVFSLGKLSYFNSTIQTGSGVSSVDFLTGIGINQPTGIGPTVYPSTLDIINSPNSLDAQASADYVKFPPKTNIPPVNFKTPEGAPLTLEILGFGEITGDGFSNRIDEFRVLEGKSASANLIGRFANPCELIVRDAVKVEIKQPSIQAIFTPNFDLTLKQAADICGYDHFNWYQEITHDPLPIPARDESIYPGGKLTPPYFDAPLGGSTTYLADFGPGYGDDYFPFYWDEYESRNPRTRDDKDARVSKYTTDKTLTFFDEPSRKKLDRDGFFGEIGIKELILKLFNSGDYVGFSTYLVGVRDDAAKTYDLLSKFDWKSNYKRRYRKEGGVSMGLNTPSTEDFDYSPEDGGIFDLKQDLSLSDIPESSRRLMIANGARNIYLEESDSVNLGSDVESAAVPEPTTLLGLGVAAATGAFFKKRRMSK